MRMAEGVRGVSSDFSLQDYQELAAAIKRCACLTELNLSRTWSSPRASIIIIAQQPHLYTRVIVVVVDVLLSLQTTSWEQWMAYLERRVA